jgi:hypothetical protein
MTMSRSFSSHASRRFLPRLEALESRWCPSSGGITQHGHTLLIQGDGSNNTITISDDGRGDVTARIHLSNSSRTVTATGITDIKIDAGGGNDTIGYALTGALSESEQVMLCLDRGSSQACFDYSAGLMRSTLAMTIGGGSGRNQLSTTFGALTGSRLNLSENLGSGGATSHVNFAGQLEGSDATVVVHGGSGNDQVYAAVGDETNANLQFLANLGTGASSFDLESAGNLLNSIEHFDVSDNGTAHDTITYNASGVNVDTTSRLNLETDTYADSDTVHITYSGAMEGELDVTAQGGSGNDTMDVSLTLARDSNGRVHGHVNGDTGNDTLTFDVYDNSGANGHSNLALLNAVLNGGAGKDALSATPNVKVIQ